MNWKITLRFIITITIVNMIVLLLVFSSISYYLYGESLFSRNTSDINEIYSTPAGAEKFASDFFQFIEFKDNDPYVSEEGIEILKKYNGWIQILDNNGDEVYNNLKPDNAPIHYSPVEIVHAYKYNGVIGDSSIFIGMIKNNDLKYSYIIGLPYNLVARYVVYFNFSNIFKSYKQGIFVTLFSTLLVTISISYLFGRKLTNPLSKIIDGIKILADGDYNVYYPEKGVYKDIYSNLNNLSIKLKESKIEKENLNKIRENWIENFCHDVKTPLSSIKGYGEILLDDIYISSNEEKDNYLKIILEKTDYIENLLNDLKLTYKLQNSLIPLNKQKINLNDFMVEIIVNILNHPLYENRKVNFSHKENPIFIDLDTHLFSRAINNLVYNALIHNTKDTVINISISNENGICILIEDNGTGMSKEKLAHPFDRNYNDKSLKENKKGSGRGMIISKEIIEAHGGNIQVTSQLGKGTKITIAL
ncbi:HAMP domain-containing histidine kinase [Tissierella sp. MSJ-40]|uniref:histidine kinase n=1 Tax=Tissierella simiarum TaxID=2841534 RepID=A0ABS6EAJ6_9FIRM|nr:HAMP domain-containing sensor histidine kinase [Tissierella simiarum]MBU5439942.1 HAMP domain-containing histidine kinase [Tissierella simiarum]